MLNKLFGKIKLVNDNSKKETIEVESKKMKDRFAKKSYAQCGEDILVAYLLRLRGVRRPTYIDIGANNPWALNNTALFYEDGCRGINVEPNPYLIKIFQDERPEDVNLNMGVGSENGEMDFYILKDDRMSTFSRKDAEEFVSKGHEINEVKKIKVLKIVDVIDQYAGGKFPDLLSLDVEGLEMDVLRGIDFKNNYPKVICVETAEYSTIGAGAKREELMEYVESMGYYLYADTNLNSIYVKNEFWYQK